MQLTLETAFKDSKSLCDEIVANVEPWPKIRALSLYIVACSALYGAAMGLYHSVTQSLVAAAKVPTLFTLTLLICLPTLHFVGLLFGSRVRFLHTVTVLLTGIAVTAILLGAFSPIALFFLVTGSRYAFLLLMHVAVFTFCGAAGLVSIGRNIRHVRTLTVPEDAPDSARLVLRVWMLLYMFVGTQMAYVLSPFVGRETTFYWFFHPPGNFYTYLLDTIAGLFR